MDTIAVWIMGLVFIAAMALIGLVYTIAWLIDLVLDRNNHG